MSMRRKAEYVRRNAFLQTQKFKQLIADACMTFQGTSRVKHGAQPWQKHHFIAKEFMRKIKQGIYTSILARFQNDEVFHTSQLQHQWTEEWCEYLGCVGSLDITHNASPEQRERYAALYHFRYHPTYTEKDPTEKSSRLSRNYSGHCQHEQRSRSESTDHIEKKQMSRWSGPREAWMGNMALTHLEMVLHGEPTLRCKFYTEASSRIRRRASLGKKEQVSGNREELTLTSDNWWNAYWWNKSGWGKIKMDLEWWSLRVFNPWFRTHVVATTVCATVGVHTHSCRTQIFFAWRTDIAHTHGSSVCQKVCCMCMSHIFVSPSPLSCFIRRPCCSRTVTSTPPSRPHRLRRAVPHTKSAGQAHFRTSAEEVGYLADPTHSARWAVHFQHFLQYIQVSFTRRLNIESARLASGICWQRWISRRRLVWTRRIWEHYLEKKSQEFS